MNLVDTSGWIEYFFNEANSDFFASAIEDVEKLIVPVVCIYEVFKKVLMVADESKALQVIAQMRQGIVVDLTEEIALNAAICSRQYKLPMADSFIYATGLNLNAVIWTQDADFKGLDHVKYIDKS